MSLLKSEPFAAVTSMEELLAIAYAMEQEAITGYSDLAERMRKAGRPEMVAVFERLISEEKQHLGHVVRWSEEESGKAPDLADLRWQPTDTFDDEGAGVIAPQLLSAYRIFAMAVRNEERAFLFWTYVAAQANKAELREASEQMAREELGHLATLRRERRRAFHARHDAAHAHAAELPELERGFAAHLEAASASRAGVAAVTLQDLARQARQRAADIARAPLGLPLLLKDGVPADVAGRMAPLCELLLDCYLDLGEQLPDEAGRQRAQRFAADMIAARSAIRAAMDLPEEPPSSTT